MADVASHEPPGTLVWGKLPTYDWWPGSIINYELKKDKAKGEVEEMDEDEDDVKEVVWVRWFGDNQISEVGPSVLATNCYILSHLIPLKLLV